MELQELRDEPLAAATPAGFALTEVVVRLVPGRTGQMGRADGSASLPGVQAVCRAEAIAL